MKRKRTKHLKAILFCLTLLAVVLSACQSDLYEIEEVETLDFGIVDARNWFEANAHLLRPNEVLTRNATGEEEVVTLNPVFNWNLAELSRDPNWEVVELPWEYEGIERIFALWEVWQHAYANNFVPDNVTRLVLVENRQTGVRFGFKMRIAPTLDFLLNHGESLHSNTYLHRDSRLSGIVMFYTLDGEFMNGWRISNGEIVAALVAKRKTSIEMNTPRTRCCCGWWNSDPNNNEVLDQLVIVADRPEGGSSGWTGVWNWGNVFEVEPGEEVPFPGWGSGAGSAARTAAECAPNASQMFTNATMSCDEWGQLEQMIVELKQNCMGKALFNELSPTPVRPIDIVFQESTVSTFNKPGHSMTLSRTGGTAHLFHELFHAVQHAAGGYGQLNREIEAFLAEYLFARTQPWFREGNKRYHFFTINPLGASIAGLAHFIDASGNRLSRFSQTDIDNHIRHNERVGNVSILGPYELFRASRRADGVTPTNYAIMHFSTTAKGDQNFRTLQRISINCR